MAERRALVIASPGAFGLQDAPELIPGPGEVVARPVYTGICGTDLELLVGVVDPAYARYPLVPGHEWSGVIEAVGPGVTGLEPGQRIIAEGIIPDRVCAECVRGNTNLCLAYDEIGFTRPGAAADQVLVPAQVVHVLGASVSLLEAALAEPAAVAWRAIRRGEPVPGERVAVVGDGTLGLITAHLLGLYSPAEGPRPTTGTSRGFSPFSKKIPAVTLPSNAISRQLVLQGIARFNHRLPESLYVPGVVIQPVVCVRRSTLSSLRSLAQTFHASKTPPRRRAFSHGKF